MIKKYYIKEIVIAVLFIALLLMSNCSQKLQGERNVLKDQLKQEVDGVATFRKNQKILFDSLSAENKKKDTKIAELHQDNKKKDGKIAQLWQSNKSLDTKLKKSAEKLVEKKKEIATYTYANSAEYINNYFKGTDAIPTEKSVNLEQTLPNLVVAELEEKKTLVEDVKDYKSKIENKDKELAFTNGKLVNKDEEIKLEKEKGLNKDLALASKEIETKKLDKALETSLELNAKTEKQLLTQKVLKWVFIGIGGTVGYIAAKQL